MICEAEAIAEAEALIFFRNFHHYSDSNNGRRSFRSQRCFSFFFIVKQMKYENRRMHNDYSFFYDCLFRYYFYSRTSDSFSERSQCDERSKCLNLFGWNYYVLYSIYFQHRQFLFADMKFCDGKKCIQNAIILIQKETTFHLRL